MELPIEQIDRVYKSARLKREWMDSHPDIDSWEKYVRYSDNLNAGKKD